MSAASLVAEFARLGALEGAPVDGASGWRLDTDANRDHALCGTYPSALAVPAAASTAQLVAAARHRSRRRLPVLSWRHPANGAALVRGAQPCPGALFRRSAADEAWFRMLRAACGEGATLLLFDARSAAAAHATAAA